MMRLEVYYISLYTYGGVIAVKDDIKVFRRIVQLCKGHWMVITFALVLLLVTTLLTLLPPLLIKSLLDSISNDIVSNHALLFIIALFLIPILTAALQTLQFFITTKIGYQLQRFVRIQIEKKIFNMDFSSMSTTVSGEMASRAQRDVTTIQSMVNNIIFPFCMLVSTVAISTVISFTISWQLTLAMLVLYPITLLPSNLLAKRQTKTQADVLKEQDAYTGYMSDVFRGVRTVKLFNRQDDEIEKLEKRYAKIEKQLIKIDILGWINNLVLNNSVGGLVNAFTYGLGFVLIMNQSLTLGGLVAFAAIVPALYASITQMTRLNAAVKMQSLAFDRMDEILDLPQEKEDGTEVSVGDIEFRNVNFSYHKESEPVLNDVSFTVPTQSFCAIVGTSGSGKSTIFDLLCKFISPDNGAIMINNTNLSEVSIYSLRNMISRVSQDEFMFNRSIYENITYGCVDITRADVINAAKAAGIHDFITSLADGYDTVISESAQNISGGECQRIAIARGLAKKASIFLFDEITSALDTYNEQNIVQIVSELRKKHTVVFISHRLSSITTADKILVLQNGRIVEEGSHDTLYNLKGQYYEMYQGQQTGGF